MASMLTRDGVRLDADIYRPAGSEKLPILLMRQPYGRKIASTVVYAHPQWYADQGYIVVIQDVRGRGSSEGEFRLFETEVEDGQDSLDWLATLPNSTGEVGMYGFSYQGMTQLYAGASGAKNLKALCPAMIAWDLYQDWVTENDAFCLQMNLGWAVQLAADSARRRGDQASFQKLYAHSRNLSFSDAYPANPNWFQRLAPDSFYHDWLRYPADHNYWRRVSPHQRCQGLDLPMLHIGGWFDPHLRGNLALYRAMAQKSSLQKLVIGPWSHFPWGRRTGALDYGESAVSKIDHLQIAWFDAILKGKNNGILADAPVQVFELGSSQWLNRADFPEAQSQAWYLSSSGLASVQEFSGKLSPTPTVIASYDTWVHDPWRPVPALGGHATMPAGQQERSALDARTDVLIYTSEPLVEDIQFWGIPRMKLMVESDCPSFDLAVVLSEVWPDGQVYNISQGYCRRLKPDDSPLEFSLQAIAARLLQGHRLRLSLSGASFPAYAVNAGRGQTDAESRLLDQQVITLELILAESIVYLPLMHK